MTDPGMVLLDPYWRALPDDEPVHRFGSRNADVPMFRLGDIRTLVQRRDAKGEPLECPPERVRELADRLAKVDWKRWEARVCLISIGKYRHLSGFIPWCDDHAARCAHAAMTMVSFELIDEAFEALEWAEASATRPAALRGERDV